MMPPRAVDEARRSGSHRARAELRMLDQERLELLRLHDFAGPHFEQLRDELWDYAMPVLKAKMRSGHIFAMCFDKNVVLDAWPDERKVLHRDLQERDDLAVDTITAAMAEFRQTLMRGRWTPEGGSSLQTFFIGACLFAFGSVFRTWSRARRQHLAEILGYGDVNLLAEQAVTAAISSANPEHAALTRDAVGAIVRNSPPETRMICALIMCDQPFSEIARRLGITERAVEGRMRRLRNRVHRTIETGHTEHPAPLTYPAPSMPVLAPTTAA